MDPEPAAAEALDDEPPRYSEEQRRVHVWRYRQIRALGFQRLESRLLAESDAEIALLRRLIEHGCPTSLAFNITL